MLFTFECSRPIEPYLSTRVDGWLPNVQWLDSFVVMHTAERDWQTHGSMLIYSAVANDTYSIIYSGTMVTLAANNQ